MDEVRTTFFCRSSWPYCSTSWYAPATKCAHSMALWMADRFHVPLGGPSSPTALDFDQRRNVLRVLA